MSISKSKDNLLLERITTELGVESDSASDLINLIHILLKTNDKDELTKELKEIYEGNMDVDSFADWVWNLYNEQDQNAHEETKSEFSDLNEKKAQASITSSIQHVDKSTNNIKSTEKEADKVSNLNKKARPAIYDEYERMQKVENIKNINMKAKNTEKQKAKTNLPPNPPNTQIKPNNQYNQNAPFNSNGKRPLPPAAPKEESKPSILDRIIKPGDKNKKVLDSKNQTQNKPNIVLHTSKYEEIAKKVKPNPEIKPTFSTNNPPKTFPEKQKKSQYIKPVENQSQAMNIEGEQAQGENEQGTGPQKLKVRCRNWPLCKNEACPYHHPTENCKFFPACPYGNKCLYIHPAINCKFGEYCQRPNCAYVHPRVTNQYYGFGGPTKKPFKGNPNNAAYQQGANQSQSQNGNDFEMDQQNQVDAGQQ